MATRKSRATAKKKSAKSKSSAGSRSRTAQRSAAVPTGDYVTTASFRRAFSNLIVMADRPTHSGSGINKFEQIKTNIASGNTKDIFYLLASFVFDLHLRMVYIVEALKHVGPGDADRAFVATVERELGKINGDPNLPVRPWEDTAKDAFEVMMDAHTRIHAKRGDVIERALR